MGYCDVADVREEIITDKTDPQIQDIIDEKTEFIEKNLNTTYTPEGLPKPVSRACVILVCKEIDPDYQEEAMVTDQKVGDFSIKKKITELTDKDAITGFPYVDVVFKLYKKVDIGFISI